MGNDPFSAHHADKAIVVLVKFRRKEIFRRISLDQQRLEFGREVDFSRKVHLAVTFHIIVKA